MYLGPLYNLNSFNKAIYEELIFYCYERKSHPKLNNEKKTFYSDR